MNLMKLTIIFFSSFLFTPSIFSNTQNLVIGLGMGHFAYSSVDYPHERQIYTEDSSSTTRGEVQGGYQGQFYIEWYLFGNLGIGFRQLSTFNLTFPIPIFESIVGNHFEDKITINSRLITLQWIFLGSKSYARLGGIVGSGTTNYKWETSCSGTSLGRSCEERGILNQNRAATGNAQLTGLFLDWGGDDFGARLGYNQLKTDSFSELKNEDSSGNITTISDLDGSGSGYYLDFRWAW